MESLEHIWSGLVLGDDGNVGRVVDARLTDRPSGLADPPARAHGPVGDRPPHVATKLGRAVAALHWLNAQIVGHGLKGDR